jgi:hypothetical protein
MMHGILRIRRQAAYSGTRVSNPGRVEANIGSDGEKSMAGEEGPKKLNVFAGIGENREGNGSMETAVPHQTTSPRTLYHPLLASSRRSRPDDARLSARPRRRRVVVLEKHADFFRDFRGDTVHPSTLQVMDELG